MPSASGVRRVHLVFKTHLDVGFTDLAAAVVARYLDDYLPRALALARTMRAAGPDRFVWTTGSWLVWRALETLRGARLRELEDGIAAGDIRWHALPFTTHSELMDAALFRRGLGIARQLDRRFARRTIAAKMTDVPGHTRAIVPLLAEAGVRLLHIGVNPVCRVPAVPWLFRWRSGEAEVMVAYDAAYGDVAVSPGGAAALVFGFTGDNHGPPAPERIAEDYRAARARFPGAAVAATALDDFALELERDRRRLPVVTAEIGDSWIHGAGSDPAKLAGFRALQGVHAQLRRGIWTVPWGKRIEAFGRALLPVPEHTWGLDIKTHLGRIQDGPAAVALDRRRYRARDFRAARRSRDYRRCEASWREQRDYLDAAVRVLGRGAPGRLARELLDEAMRPPRWSDAGLRPLPGGRLRSLRWDAVADPASGAIIRLTDRLDGRAWADRAHPLAAFRHQCFAWADYRRWLREYTRDLARHAAWAVPDLAKPGMDIVPARSGFALPRRVRIRQHAGPDGQRLVVDLAMPAAAVARGCPREVRLGLLLPDAPELPPELEVAWRGKDAIRLPEASWLDVRPLGVDPASWRLLKMGERIDPVDVVAGGGRFLHAVEAVEARGFQLVPVDAALVAPGGPRLLRADDALPDLRRGISVNLHNNVWGTNFPMWYGEDARFRFRFELG